MEHVVPDTEQCLNDPHYVPIFYPVPALNFSGWASCDWFSADALYTGNPPTHPPTHPPPFNLEQQVSTPPPPARVHLLIGTAPFFSTFQRPTHPPTHRSPTALPKTTDLSTLTFPLNRTYVVLGINQPRLGKSIYSNLLLTALSHFEGKPIHPLTRIDKTHS